MTTALSRLVCLALILAGTACAYPVDRVRDVSDIVDFQFRENVLVYTKKAACVSASTAAERVPTRPGLKPIPAFVDFCPLSRARLDCLFLFADIQRSDPVNPSDDPALGSPTWLRISQQG